MTTRRRFLFDSAAFLAMALLPLKGPAAVAAPSTRFMALDDLSFAALAAQLNTWFNLYSVPQASLKLQLIEATLGPEALWPGGGPEMQPARYERFSLVFAGPLEPLLEQRIYPLEHPVLGRFEMFIVPILSRDQTHIHYQAVFNRPVRETTSNV
jgi:hypothetical protein